MGAHRGNSQRQGKAQEQGFVLLAALWLLLLVGAIGAFLMARSLHATAVVKNDEIRTRERFALVAAIDTVVADAMFNGPRSRWYQLPASGSVMIGDTQVAVLMTPENGRLDLNTAPLELIDDMLRGLGASAAERFRLKEALEAHRDSSRQIISIPESIALMRIAGVREPRTTCLADMITAFTALPAPRLGLAPEALRGALSRAGQVDGLGEPGGVAIGPTEPVRIVATVGQGRQVNAVLRITGTSDNPYMVHHWSAVPLCATTPVGQIPE